MISDDEDRMRRQPLKNTRSCIVAALLAAVAALLAFQILTTTHAAKYGDGPHDHNGKACVLSLVSQGGDKVITASAIMLAVLVTIWRAGAQIVQTECAAIAIRAARPRGPQSR